MHPASTGNGEDLVPAYLDFGVLFDTRVAVSR